MKLLIKISILIVGILLFIGSRREIDDTPRDEHGVPRFKPNSGKPFKNGF